MKKKKRASRGTARRNDPTRKKAEPRTGMITATSVQVRDPNRLSVFVDDTFSFGMPYLAAKELGIGKGTAVDADLLEKCLAAEELYRARQRALGLLSHRARSTVELRSRLRQSGFGSDAVESAIERMKELGYLNDADFAESFARNRLLTRGFGTRRVMNELRQKGIDGGQAEKIVAELNTDRDELADARAHAERHVSRQPSSLAPRKKRERLYAYLARRGFTGDTIRMLLDEFLPRS